MQILKVLNNSLVLALDELGKECILMGKGIGYRKSLGEPINSTEIEKTFILQDKKMLQNFVTLASTLDETYFNLVKEIVDYATKKYHLVVMDYVYLSLSDHLAYVVQRTKSNQVSDCFNYSDVMLHHQVEYHIGQDAVKRINQALKIQLPESEAAAIGLHLLNAELNTPVYQREQKIHHLVNNIEKIVQRSIKTPLKSDSFTYSRFLTHLNYFGERVYDQQLFKAADATELYQTMAAKMPEEVKIVKAIDNFVQQNASLKVTDQEKIYLLVHLHRLVEKK